MREFVKDYVDLCKDSGRFYKKHWKGVILLTVVIIGAEYVWCKHSTKKFNRCFEEEPNAEEAQ